MSHKWINKQGLEEQEERIEFNNNIDILEAIKQYGSKSTYEAAKLCFD